MTAQQLKNSILQMAIQGKLVPQDPNDEPASVLLERIRAEKEEMIKEGKIKKEKNPSVIFRGADNLFYEKVGDQEPVCIADEVPFEIPERWEWARLGDLFCVEMGQSPKGETVSEVNIGVEFHQGKVFFGDKYLMKSNLRTQVPTKLAPAYSVLLCVRAPVGKVNITDREICIGRGLCSITPIYGMSLDFVYYMLETYEDIFVKQATGTTFIAITGAVVKSQLVPVPPLNEQSRIAKRIKTIIPFLEQYENLEKQLENINIRFPDQLKKSILQRAVQGKLVPQDSNDEPASVLLEKIRAEKEQLIQSGKIKRDKHESVIYRRDGSYYEKVDGIERCVDEEIPFDIPESWEWVRLDDICVYIQRGKSPKYSPIKKYPVVAQKCNQWEGFSIEKAKFIDPDSIKTYGKERILQDNDLMWNSTGLGTLGRMAVYKEERNPYGLAVADSHVTVIRPLKKFVKAEYLYFYFAGPSVQLVIENLADGSTKQKELSTTTIKNYFVPIPPYNEQNRIINKIEDLLSILRDFKGGNIIFLMN